MRRNSRSFEEHEDGKEKLYGGTSNTLFSRKQKLEDE